MRERIGCVLVVVTKLAAVAAQKLVERPRSLDQRHGARC